MAKQLPEEGIEVHQVKKGEGCPGQRIAAGLVQD